MSQLKGRGGRGEEEEREKEKKRERERERERENIAILYSLTHSDHHHVVHKAEAYHRHCCCYEENFLLFPGQWQGPAQMWAVRRIYDWLYGCIHSNCQTHTHTHTHTHTFLILMGFRV